MLAEREGGGVAEVEDSFNRLNIKVKRALEDQTENRELSGCAENRQLTH